MFRIQFCGWSHFPKRAWARSRVVAIHDSKDCVIHIAIHNADFRLGSTAACDATQPFLNVNRNAVFHPRQHVLAPSGYDPVLEIGLVALFS
jgi:hypothetical protein